MSQSISVSDRPRCNRHILVMSPDPTYISNGALLRKSSAGACCTNPVRDSSFESRVVDGGHEQTHRPRLQDQELAGL